MTAKSCPGISNLWDDNLDGVTNVRNMLETFQCGSFLNEIESDKENNDYKAIIVAVTERLLEGLMISKASEEKVLNRSRRIVLQLSRKCFLDLESLCKKSKFYKEADRIDYFIGDTRICDIIELLTSVCNVFGLNESLTCDEIMMFIRLLSDNLPPGLGLTNDIAEMLVWVTNILKNRQYEACTKLSLFESHMNIQQAFGSSNDLDMIAQEISIFQRLLLRNYGIDQDVMQKCNQILCVAQEKHDAWRQNQEAANRKHEEEVQREKRRVQAQKDELKKKYSENIAAIRFVNGISDKPGSRKMLNGAVHPFYYLGFESQAVPRSDMKAMLNNVRKKLCKLTHPDKVPPEETENAKRAFQTVTNAITQAIVMTKNPSWTPPKLPKFERAPWYNELNIDISNLTGQFDKRQHSTTGVRPVSQKGRSN